MGQFDNLRKNENSIEINTQPAQEPSPKEKKIAGQQAFGKNMQAKNVQSNKQEKRKGGWFNGIGTPTIIKRVTILLSMTERVILFS